MDPPPATAGLSAPPHPDSVDSSPRSRTTTDAAWEAAGDALPPVPGGSKLRLMCSYGGHIVPRPHDKSLCYVGGETRIVVVERNSTLQELLHRLSQTLLSGRPFTLKYQLPNEDLDSLITVSAEEDLENMIDEYDRLSSSATASSKNSSRIRLFLFPAKLEMAASMGPILDRSNNKSDEWFLSALNGEADLLQRGFSDPASVNCLLGLNHNNNNSNSNSNLDPNSSPPPLNEEAAGQGLGGGRGKIGNLSNPDVHSVFEDTNSSFGSANSSPAMVNLPPIRVHVEEARVFDQQQYPHMGVHKHQQEEGLGMISSPPSNSNQLPSSSSVSTGVPAGEYNMNQHRIVSDDERSDHGGGYRRGQPPHPVNVMLPTTSQNNKVNAEDLPSPVASVSSDSSLSNATTRQKPPIYQDPSSRLPSATFIEPPPPKMSAAPAAFTAEPGAAQLQQVSDSPTYFMPPPPPPQYDQLQPQSIQPPQQQQQQQQLQHQPQQQQQLQHQPQQQFIHASNHHYVQHHPAGGVPFSYYPVYPSQQPNHQQHQMDQQRYPPVYYVSAGQPHAYSLPVQQQQQQQQQPPNYTEAAANMAASSQPQPPPPSNAAAYNTLRKADAPQAGVYRAAATTTAATPQQILQQVPSSHHHPQQQQLMGYPPIHHPSQSIAPSATAAYAYDFADPAHTQVYFTQPLAPQLASQYQTMTSTPPTAVSSEALSASDTVKPQIRTSQAL